jgi:hypothetical protein
LDGLLVLGEGIAISIDNGVVQYSIVNDIENTHIVKLCLG